MTQTSLFTSGVIPAINDYLLKKSQEKRDYGDYWSASSAGYCKRKNIFDRMKVPYTTEDARKQRVFTAGHIFHSWIQEITRATGLSIAQETELIDSAIMVKGHIDDLILIDSDLILYDYKTQNSRAFTWAKKTGRGMSYFHKMQLGTYMLMLRNGDYVQLSAKNLTEARILKISKDDLRMLEEQLIWSPELQSEVLEYWNHLNELWANGTIPECTCADKEGGFMAKEQYNPYFYNGQPCSLEWLEKCVNEGLVVLPGGAR